LAARMEKNSYDIEAKVENFHWWFVVRRKLLKRLLHSFGLSQELSVVDIGCGTGSNLRVLQSVGLSNVVGLDRSFYALSLAKRKVKLPLLSGEISNLPIRPESVGLIIAFDVMEHIDDDLNAIRQLYQVLRKGGILILTVPAFNLLWGIQDVVTGHKRRYLREEIENKLKGVGFDLLKSSYFNFFLFFPILMARRLIHLLGLEIESENEVNFPFINFFFKGIFSLEIYVLKYLSFPFGVSILCIAKKKER
jgi:SAM-dependent methyltransferase